MNIYEKLQISKSELKKLNPPKTGKNKFANYDYWELSDFLPTVVSLFESHKMCSVCSFTPELATLQIINSEKPEEIITVTSPMAAADLKGCHAIQNTGAVETYQRRYLYMAALDISEPDALDGTQGSSQQPAPQSKHKSLKCSKCGAEIKGIRQGENVMTAQEVADKYGVCATCLHKEMEAAKAAQK